MPSFDGTGPTGQGPMTGGRFGYCWNFKDLPFEIAEQFLKTNSAVYTGPVRRSNNSSRPRRRRRRCAG